MSSLNMDLGVLEHQMHQAHRNAVQAELSAAGLQEVGHPLLLCILRSAGERCPDGQAQRELAELLNISPTAKGEKAVDDCFACLQRVTRRMFTGFTTEEQAVMRGFYLRMLENLQAPLAGVRASPLA